MTLAELNALGDPAFVAALDGVIEHSPWVVEAVVTGRPFTSIAALHGALVTALNAAPDMRKRAVLSAHPMLAGREARAGTLTAASTTEQDSAGLRQLTHEELDRFDRLNRHYLDRFGFPFIVAVKAQRGRTAILKLMATRVERDPATEFQTALDEVAAIALFRLKDRIAEAAT